MNETLRSLVEQLAGTGAVIVVPAERRRSQMAPPGVVTHVGTPESGYMFYEPGSLSRSDLIAAVADQPIIERLEPYRAATW